MLLFIMFFSYTFFSIYEVEKQQPYASNHRSFFKVYLSMIIWKPGYYRPWCMLAIFHSYHLLRDYLQPGFGPNLLVGLLSRLLLLILWSLYTPF